MEFLMRNLTRPAKRRREKKLEQTRRVLSADMWFSNSPPPLASAPLLAAEQKSSRDVADGLILAPRYHGGANRWRRTSRWAGDQGNFFSGRHSQAPSDQLFFLLSNVADVKSTNAPLLLGVDIFCEKKRVPPGGLVMAGWRNDQVLPVGLDQRIGWHLDCSKSPRWDFNSVTLVT